MRITITIKQTKFNRLCCHYIWSRKTSLQETTMATTQLITQLCFVKNKSGKVKFLTIPLVKIGNEDNSILVATSKKPLPGKWTEEQILRELKKSPEHFEFVVDGGWKLIEAFLK